MLSFPILNKNSFTLIYIRVRKRNKVLHLPVCLCLCMNHSLYFVMKVVASFLMDFFLSCVVKPDIGNCHIHYSMKGKWNEARV